MRASRHFGPACAAAFRALGRASQVARVVASRLFVPRGARGSWQRGRRRKRLVLFAQATANAALPSFQSSAIVLACDGVACCRLTGPSRGRLRRHLLPALGSKASNRHDSCVLTYEAPATGLAQPRAEPTGTSLPRSAQSERGWRVAPQCCAWQSGRWRRWVQRRQFTPVRLCQSSLSSPRKVLCRALRPQAPPRKASRPSTRRMHGAAGLQPPTCRFAVSRSQAWVGLAPRSRKSPWLLALCSERQPQLGEHRGVTRESSSLLRHLAGSSLSEEGA